MDPAGQICNLGPLGVLNVMIQGRLGAFLCCFCEFVVSQGATAVWQLARPGSISQQPGDVSGRAESQTRCQGGADARSR